MSRFLIICIPFFIFCTQGHKKASDIYMSGNMGDISDFNRIDHGEDSLLDIYQYKYDTFLIANINYGNDRSLIRGYAFYYKNKKEGKWILHTYEGRLLAEVNFEEDKRNGFALTYNDDKTIKEKEFYKKGNLIYKIEYTDNGAFVDSIAY